MIKLNFINKPNIVVKHSGTIFSFLWNDRDDHWVVSITVGTSKVITGVRVCSNRLVFANNSFKYYAPPDVSKTGFSYLEVYNA